MMEIPHWVTELKRQKQYEVPAAQHLSTAKLPRHEYTVAPLHGLHSVEYI